MEHATPVFHEHREALTRALAADLRRLGPRSLLDAGCGSGLLLDLLRDVASLGVEHSPRRLSAARERGLRVVRGDGRALPAPTRTFDWVVVRHVLHHLDDPAAAVREAWRVARVGVVLAEPTTDCSIPSQARMQELDELLTAMMARAGHVHRPFLRPGELLALLPEPSAVVETRAYGRLTPVPAEEVLALGARALHGLTASGQEVRRLETLAGEAAGGKLTFNGSVAVFCIREASTTPRR